MHPFFRLVACMALILALSPIATAGPVHHDTRDLLGHGAAPEVARQSVNPNDQPGGYKAYMPGTRLIDNPGPIFCGRFNTADRPNTWKLIIEQLWGIDNFTAPANKCRRAACVNTSGVYVINHTGQDILMEMNWDIGQPAQNILDVCCQSDGGISGSETIEAVGYSIAVAYANCNHGRDDDWPHMGPLDDPWGPNGACNP